MSRVRHRAEYALLRGVEIGLAAMPSGAAAGVGAAIGSLVRRPLGIRRGVVVENLRRAFPDATPEWIGETAAAAYRHLGREAATLLRLGSLDTAAIRSLTILTDGFSAALAEARAGGSGLIFVTGHYGNWEIGAAGLAARGFPLTAIAKSMANPLVDRRVVEARRALGIETVGIREATRRVPRALAAGSVVGIVADQDARRTGVRVPFFGIPASSHRGPALFALRTGAPLFAAISRRLPDGRYLVDAHPIDTSRTGDHEGDVFRITADLAASLEREVRADPTQYFWFHKRWKTAPPEEPASLVSGTTST